VCGRKAGSLSSSDSRSNHLTGLLCVDLLSMSLSGAELLLAPFMDRLGSTFQFVFRGNIPDRTMQPYYIVMLYIMLHHVPRFVQKKRCFRSYRLALQTLVPAFNFSVALGIERRSAHISHAHQPNVFLEVPGHKLRAVVRDDPRIRLGKPLPASLHNDLYIGLRHLFADLPVHDVAAEPIQNTAQIVERTTNIEVGDVDVPMRVGATRTLKSLAFLRGSHTFAADQPRAFEHPIY
jgi:hypothetical protein